MTEQIIIFIAIVFSSYAVGRVSHVLGGQLNTPHHWIYGVIAVVSGIVIHDRSWALFLLAFGLGFIISDLVDMLKLRFFGPDEPGVRKFWGID